MRKVAKLIPNLENTGTAEILHTHKMGKTQGLFLADFLNFWILKIQGIAMLFSSLRLNVSIIVSFAYEIVADLLNWHREIFHSERENTW